MSAKYFCDVCGNEMKASEHARLRLEINDVSVEIMHSFKGVWNSGHVCHGCLKKIVAEGEPSEHKLGV